MAKKPGRRGAPTPAASARPVAGGSGGGGKAARPVKKGGKRNEFGDARDTLYAGGTPRFDETGGLAGKRPPPRKRTR
jgi:hypothetical protein